MSNRLSPRATPRGAVIILLAESGAESVQSSASRHRTRAMWSVPNVSSASRSGPSAMACGGLIQVPPKDFHTRTVHLKVVDASLVRALVFAAPQVTEDAPRLRQGGSAVHRVKPVGG